VAVALEDLLHRGSALLHRSPGTEPTSEGTVGLGW
jgi:hypothetical protein